MVKTRDKDNIRKPNKTFKGKPMTKMFICGIVLARKPRITVATNRVPVTGKAINIAIRKNSLPILKIYRKKAFEKLTFPKGIS